MAQRECIICRSPTGIYQAGADWNLYDCPRCGRFRIKPMAEFDLVGELRDDTLKRAALSHLVRRIAWTNEIAEIRQQDVPSLLASAILPSPAQQADNLILWIANRSPVPGEFVEIPRPLDELEALVGVASPNGLAWIIDHLEETGLVEQPDNTSLKLTFSGWKRFEDFKTGQVSGTYAFMAMAFGQEPLTTIVNEYFRPAVAQTGFPLKRVDDKPRAGLIDDWLRVDIRGCRFLIADLTHHNNGAYWEAGYAEGMGKSVIYTCERSVFVDRSRGTHFDTNHHLTVIWDCDRPEEAAAQLKATIRASVPDAKQSDE